MCEWSKNFEVEVIGSGLFHSLCVVFGVKCLILNVLRRIFSFTISYTCKNLGSLVLMFN